MFRNRCRNRGLPSPHAGGNPRTPALPPLISCSWRYHVRSKSSAEVLSRGISHDILELFGRVPATLSLRWSCDRKSDCSHLPFTLTIKAMVTSKSTATFQQGPWLFSLNASAKSSPRRRHGADSDGSAATELLSISRAAADHAIRLSPPRLASPPCLATRHWLVRFSRSSNRSSKV